MLKNHLTIAWRQILKRKGYSLLNILGLAIGIASCLLILYFVMYERSFDKFHEKGSNIYRLRLDSHQNGELAWQSATVFPAFAPTMKTDFPEVIESCRIHDAEMVMTNPENNVKFSERKGYYADPAFLEMFNLNLLIGDPSNALSGPDKIILSESSAKKYFGTENALGKQIMVKDPDLIQFYEVTGVFEDYPDNSHLILDYLVSYETLSKIVAQVWRDTTDASNTSWGWYDFYTYLELEPGTDVETFKAKFPAFVDKYINAPRRERGSNTENVIDIIPMQDIHLYSNVNQEAEVNGNGKAVSLLFLVAFFILAIAWINYINLATARSLERSKEVGLRKVLGAERKQLIVQFLTESLLLNFGAFLLALVIVQVTLPVFQGLFELPDSNILSANPVFLIGATLAFFTGAILSGIYPAFVLSGFRPLTVLRGMFKNSTQGTALRKGLIVFQFMTSIALIAGTVVIYKQLQFMRNQNLGVDIEHTLVLNGPNAVQDSLYEGQYQPFRSDVLQIPGVRKLTSSAYVPGDEIYWTNGARWLKPEANSFTIYTQGIDETFLEAYELDLLAGRNFSKDRGEDDKACLLNRKAAKLLGFPSVETAIGERVVRGRDTLTVAGITNDFHHLGLQKAIDPIIFLYRPEARSYYSIKVEAGNNVASIINEVQGHWNRHFPDDPFDYFFLDSFFDQQYKADMLFGKVFTFFALLAIFVASLGLFGLSSYDVLQRTKEIGIRKVLGATTTSLVGLLSKDFIKLVILALVVASPIAWYFMDKWLADFAYRINIGWWVFALAGLMAILIAFMTVSFQSVKAALSNPIKSLRSE